ncbi:MAG: DUF2189 domain-containing protein, partial [Candidatus Eiseniibacteriota bacterium]
MAEAVPVFTSPSPVINRIAVDRPWGWLARGLQDMRRAGTASVAYGALFAILGLVMVGFAWIVGLRAVVLPLVAGFFLVGPILAVGLYDISRRLERGEPVTVGKALGAWRGNASQIALMGLVLMLFFLAWIRVATLVYALFFGGQEFELGAIVERLVLTVDGLTFLVVGTVIGAILAALVFAVSAVSIPMLLDRDVDVISAIATSVVAMRENPLP